MKLFKTTLSLAFAGLLLVPLGSHAKAGKQLILNLVGVGDMYESTVPDIDGDGIDDDAICFDVDLLNAKNGKVIGTGTDCLSNITPVGATGLSIAATTYFNMHEGQLVVRGNTTVQPYTAPITTPGGMNVTHITGAGGGSDNAVISGTGRFHNASGTVRLSGMVDMGGFGGNPGDPIGFDCVFFVTLD